MQTSDLAELVFAPWLQGRGDDASTRQFLAVPGKGTPRWLLPDRHANIDSVLANWTPYRLDSRMKWAAIRGAHRAGCLSALPGVASVNVAGVADIDWCSLGWSSGGVVPVPVVYIGTPGASRKAVIHLVNPDSGICDAIVKVPLTAAARTAILREADVLQILADEGCNCSPRLLHVDRDRGVTTQAALNGRAGGRKFTDGSWALLGSLMLTGESTAIAGHAAEWQEQLLQAVGCEADIGAMTAAMAELCDAGQVPACWRHGDFAPWNIRQMAEGRVVLLDWEDAQRSGLPLQDAFHFLHMQDYLFGARPAAHSPHVERWAKGLGLSSAQCRKLEIAYLTYSCLQRLAERQDKHYQYLLKTLLVLLPARRRLLAWPALGLKPAPEPGKTVPLVHRSGIRKNLFSAVIAQLNSAEVPYCVLGRHESQAASHASDIDFMFHPRDAGRIAPLLAQAAKSAGAYLIQSIQHETTGCYFVMAKQDEGEVGYLDPDCACDYRRQGRLWLSAENLLARSRRSRDIEVPAVSDDFTYYLIKKVLKQSLAGFQLRRLRHLYQRAPVPCRAEILRFWSLETVHGVERALVEDDLRWFQLQMPRLLAELRASRPAESLGQRLVQRFRDAVRTARRALYPTGMSVLICGGGTARRTEIAEGLVRQLAPAFRWTATVHLPSRGLGLANRFQLATAVFQARRRSTFVIATVGDDRTIARTLSSRLAHLLLQPDLMFVLADEVTQSFEGDVERSVQRTTRTILRWLAERQEKRLSLHRATSSELPVTGAGNRAEPVGLHLVVR